MSDENTIELNRRRVLGGVVTIGAAAAAAGAGTFAAFSDTESSNGNSIQAGTLDLQSATGASFPTSNIIPGWNGTPSIETTYNSSSTVDPVDVEATLGLDENDLASTPTDSDQSELTAVEFAQKIEVNSATLGDGASSVDLTDGVSAQTTGHPNSQSYIDLSQITGTYSLTGVDAGDTVAIDLDLTMPEAVGNAAQGDGVDIDVTFVANQP